MGLTTVKDVFYRASVLLKDNSPQFKRWTEREMVAWLNDAQQAVAKFLPSSCTRRDAFKLAPGALQYIGAVSSDRIKPCDGSAAVAIRGNALVDVSCNRGADGLTPGRAIRVVSRESKDAYSPNWRAATPSTTVEEVTFDPRDPKYFNASPPVHATMPVWVELVCMADPVPIAWPGTPTYGMDGADTTKISVDDRNVDDLVNYLCARAYMKDAEFAANQALAGAYTQQFVSSLNAQAESATGVNPNLTSLPLSPQMPATAS